MKAGKIDATTEKKQKKPLPLSYARTLSWLSLLFILITSLGLSFFIASSVRNILLRKQEDFTRLLVENLNSQIYRRFAIPTVLAGGRIALRNPVQYERLDRVIRSVIEGLPVERARIFDFAHLAAYSTNREETGKTGLAPAYLSSVLHEGKSSSEIISSIPPWQAWFHVPLAQGTFVVRVLAPLRGEPSSPDEPAPVLGALELTQDITDDYERVMAFQGIIVVMCLLSSVILFGLLLLLIQRAEKGLAERIQKNRKLEEELHSNEKLVSLGRVVASIAHEIRNPLGIIRSSAEFLQKRNTGADNASKRILEAIFDESVRLSQTVNDFLDYAKPRQPKMERVSLQGVLIQVTSFLEGELHRRKAVVNVDIPADLEVSGDKDLLYRAFYNIVMNGLQAMPAGGIITITARAGVKPPDDSSESSSDVHDWVEVSFQDSGPGFDEKTINNILDPFFTTKDDGTGLGLPIVQSIVFGHGGMMRLSNGREGGALIKIWLPIVAQKVDNAS